jgi:hypothetical protein
MALRPVSRVVRRHLGTVEIPGSSPGLGFMRKLSRRGFLGALAGAVAAAAAATIPFRSQPDALARELAELSKHSKGAAEREWKIGIRAYETVGFAVLDSNPLVMCKFD